MNILSDFTRKSMIARKKRTMLTLLGVCLSVAMMVAVSSFLESYMERGRDSRIAASGDWTAAFFGIPYTQIPAIRREMPDDLVSVVNDVGYVKLPNARQPNRPYLLISEYDENAMKAMNIRILEGRLPQNDRELVIPDDLDDFFGRPFKIGDTFSWKVGERVLPDGSTLSRLFPLQQAASARENSSASDPEKDRPGEAVTEKLRVIDEKTYAIVGFIDRAVTDIPGTAFFSCITALDTARLEEDLQIVAYLRNEDPPADYSQKIRELGDRLAVPSGKIATNDDLLTYYPKIGQVGQAGQDSFYTISFFILAAIFISAFILIYNSFSISSSARISQMGLLASVGATQSQKKNTVLKEGLYVCLFGIPIGVIFGLASIYFLLGILERFNRGSFSSFPFVFSVQSVIAAAVLAVVSIFSALHLPARRASRVMPLEAIRLGDSPLPKKRTRNRHGWMKIFRVEGILAQENLRSNPKRKKALIFSLSISLTVFLCVSFYIFNFFLDSEKSTLAHPVSAEDIHLVMHENQYGAVENDLLFEKIKALSRLEKILMLESIEGAYIEEAQLSELKRNASESSRILSVLYNENRCPLYILDDTAFSAYLESLDENPAFYLRRPVGIFYKNPTLPDVNPTVYEEADRDYFLPLSFSFSGMTGTPTASTARRSDIYNEDAAPKITIGKIVSLLPDLLNSQDVEGLSKVLFISRSYMEENFSDSVRGEQLQFLLRSRSHLLLENDVLEILKTYPEQSYTLINYSKSQETKESIKNISNLLSFVFLILIGILSLSNSLHSLSTGLELRRREFSMLRAVGMTPRSFQKMLFLEGLYYSTATVFLAIPASLLVNAILYIRKSMPLRVFIQNLDIFSLSQTALFIRTVVAPEQFFRSIPAIPYVSGIIAIFFSIFISEFIAVREMKKQNIIDIMRERNL